MVKYFIIKTSFSLISTSALISGDITQQELCIICTVLNYAIFGRACPFDVAYKEATKISYTMVLTS